MEKLIYTEPQCEAIDLCAEDGICSIIVASAGRGEGMTPGEGAW